MGAGASTTCGALALPVDRPEAQTFVPILEQSLETMRTCHGLTLEQRRELLTALERGSEMYGAVLLAASQHRTELKKIKDEKAVAFQSVYTALYTNNVRTDPNFDRFIQVCDEISEQVEGQNIDQRCNNNVDGLISLYEEGAIPQFDKFSKLLEEIAQESGAETTPKSSLKSMTRALEKVMFEPGPTKGDSRKCHDILRGMIIYKDMASLLNGFECIQGHSELELVRVKNRFQKPTDSGWADCLVNVQIKNDPTCHVAEIQLVHELLYNASADDLNNNGQLDYYQYRCAKELLAILEVDSILSPKQRLDAYEVRMTEIGEPIEMNLKDGILRLQKDDDNTLLNLKIIGHDNEDPEPITQLATAIENNHSLLKLSLGYNGIGTEGVTKLATALEKNSVLLSLDLEYNNITSQGISDLAAALEKNSSLLNLNLNNNKSDDEGAKRLAVALQKNVSLVNLDLQFNNIGAEGATEIATALKENVSLLELNLGYNNIGNEGVNKVATALEVNSSLVNLNLCSTSIGDEGATNLATALHKNSSLLYLNLSNNMVSSMFQGCTNMFAGEEGESAHGMNNIGNEGATKIASALEKNSSLLILNLRNNKITNEEIKEKIEAALKRNGSQRLCHILNMPSYFGTLS